MPRSSTSSSDAGSAAGGFPWAGLATVLLVIALDLAVFGRAWPWILVQRELTTENLLAAGVTSDHRALAELDAAPPGVARVALLGSSRLQAVLAGGGGAVLAGDAGVAGSGNGTFAVAALAHAGLEPFGMLALADRLAALRADVVLLLLSEFDTHRAPDARPAAAVGSPAAVGELVAALGPRRAWDSRAWLERLALASAFAAYRHREVAQAYGLGRLRRFEGVRRTRRGSGDANGAAGLAAQSETRPDLDVRRRLQIRAGLAREASQWREAERSRIRSIAWGPHVAVQMRLVAAAVDRLRASGATVVLFEAPLSPSAAELYDVATRDAFREFARALASRAGVRFAPLREPFAEDDFVDHSHANARGAARLGRSIAAAVRAALAVAP